MKWHQLTKWVLKKLQFYIHVTHSTWHGTCPHKGKLRCYATESMEPASATNLSKNMYMLINVILNNRVCVLGITLGKLIPQNFVQILWCEPWSTYTPVAIKYSIQCHPTTETHTQSKQTHTRTHTHTRTCTHTHTRTHTHAHTHYINKGIFANNAYRGLERSYMS